MTKIVRCIAVALAVLAAPAAIAQTAAEPAASPAPAAAPVVKAGAILTSAEGRKVGRIERIVKAKDGTPLSASVILDSRFVFVPVSTISAKEKGFSTSLTRAELSRLK